MKINFVSEGLPEDIKKLVEEEYKNLFAELDKIPEFANQELTVVAKQIPSRVGFEIKIEGNLLNVHRKFTNLKEYELHNLLLNLDPTIQNRGIADLVNRPGVKILEKLGGKKIILEANTDVGGYAWLRKGFWPDDGKEFLDAAIQQGVEEKLISKKLASEFYALSEAEAKEFVISKEFRKYKKALLGSSWPGSADVSNPKIRELITGEKITQAIPKTTQTINELYRDGALRHQIAVRGYSAGEAKKVAKLLEQADADLVDKLKKRLSKFGNRAVDPTSDRWKALLSDIRALRAETIKAAQDSATVDLGQFAKDEYDAELALLKSVSPLEVDFAVVSAVQLRAIATAKPFDGHLLKDWWQSLAQLDQKNLVQAIQIGMTQGQPVDDIVRRVAGTRANKYSDGVLSITRRNAQAITRTAINHVSNQARGTLWEENKTLFQAKIWSSTLDGRTSAICRARDGHGVPVGNSKLPEGVPELMPAGATPPAHVNCRSTMVAYIDGVGLVGNRPFVTDVRTRTKREIDFKQMAKDQGKSIQEVRAEWAAKNVGQVPAATTYQEFLSRQPAAFQDRVLGATKAKMFRSGKIKLDQFVDRNGNELTIDELRELHPKLSKL